MERVCFTLQVRPERIEEYAVRHAAVWPEMLAALAGSGWQNYSLFLREDGLLVGYLETPSLERALAGMASTEVNRRWQDEMAPFFVDLGDARPDGGPDAGAGPRPDARPDTAFLRLREVFHLEDQLAALQTPAPNETSDRP